MLRYLAVDQTITWGDQVTSLVQFEHVCVCVWGLVCILTLTVYCVSAVYLPSMLWAICVCMSELCVDAEYVCVCSTERQTDRQREREGGRRGGG